MSEPLSSGYIGMYRKAVESWPGEPDLDGKGEWARTVATRLMEHIDAVDERHRDEVERIKADRDALRDELEALRASPGPNDWDAKRYRRLRVLGCTIPALHGPLATEDQRRLLSEVNVSCFSNLDVLVDRDLYANASRGEAETVVIPGPLAYNHPTIRTVDSAMEEFNRRLSEIGKAVQEIQIRLGKNH